MAQVDDELTVAQRLGHLLDRGLLPAGGPAEAAERLIERLERPARIALLGLPGAGKSAILNLLTGSVVVPETLRLPTLVVQHGIEERMVCTLADGRTQVMPGRDLNDVLTLNPALVTIELDLPALKVISLLEVSAGPLEAEQRRAALWASKRADILIWCTTSYLPKEQQVWDSMPDVVKDNGFLFLTKVDLLGSREAAEGMLERVETRAGDEFREVMSISAKQARAALAPGGAVNRELFRDSGAAAVITTIKNRVQMARRADTDMAELLLARHVEVGGFVARHFADAEAPVAPPLAPVPEWVPPPEEPVADVAEVAPQADRQPEPVAVVEPEPELEPEPLPQPDLAPVVEPEPEIESLLGRKRFADRIKQMPMADDKPAQPQVPLRSTWKSKAEMAPPPPSPPEPEPEPVAAPLPASAPQPPRKPLSASLGTEPEDGAPETTPETTPEPAERTAGGDLDDDAVAAMLAAVAAAPREPKERAPLVPRPMPTDAAPATERSARTQLFGARKPAADPKPAEPAPRTGEPVARVRAPAPRPAEPSRPAVPLPEDLATPRFSGQRVPGADAADPAAPRGDRRERPRIAARAAGPAAAPAAAVPPPVTGADHDLAEATIRLIVTRSGELAGLIDPEAKVPVDLVLDHCRKTTEQALAIMGRGRSSDLQRINGDLGEILDLIMLMQLEKGHAPADDAITLLLQIRRDLETLRAA